MTNEEHNQRRQQTEVSTNSDANDTASERPRHDELFKKVMSEPVAAREFLEHYLPASFKDKINLNNIKIEQESFVTESLRKKFSDVVYSVALKMSLLK